MGKKQYSHRVTDTKELLRRYNRASKGLALEGDDEYVKYGMRRRTTVKFVEAPWAVVIMWAVINAVAINTVKYTYFYFYGKPEVFLLAEELELYNQRVSGMDPLIQEAEKDSAVIFDKSAELLRLKD